VFGRYEDGELVAVDAPARATFVREDGRVTGLEISFGGEVPFVMDRAGGSE
jgi:hypothetical protein